jgi:putative aldouronate transport system permease protein
MKLSRGQRIFLAGNYVFFILLSLLCILPLVHIFAISLSSSSAASAGLVTLWPVDFTLRSYDYIINKHEFFDSIIVSIKRLVVGTSLSLLLCMTIAYPLSKETKAFRMRTVYAWIFVFTILFNGGLIPSYMIVRYTGLLDTLWALVIPSAVNVFNVLLMLNFFRGLPKELEESAFIDGAGHWITLWRIYVPLSMPSVATVALFTMVFHWNSWFDGMIFMNKISNYPLSTYLQNVLTSGSIISSMVNLNDLAEISDRTTKAAQIFVGSLPILCVYPFLQRYFMKGIVLGSVKG